MAKQEIYEGNSILMPQAIWCENLAALEPESALQKKRAYGISGEPITINSQSFQRDIPVELYGKIILF